MGTDEALENVFSNSIVPGTGYHTFNIRVLDNDGNWSNVFKSVVFIDSAQQITVPDFSLSSGEYFWNTDPGQGNGTSLIAVDGNWDESLESVFKTITSLPGPGYNVFNIRVQDNDGNWSNVFKSVVYIDSLQQITVPDFSLSSGEYFWDTDLGQGVMEHR